jgi:histidinol dehydrogenase
LTARVDRPLFRYSGPAVSMPPDARRAIFERGRSDLEAATKAILPIREAVRARGDEAVREFTEKFDRVPKGPLALEHADFSKALARIPKDLRAALEAAARRLEAFHRRQRPTDEEATFGPGIRAGRRVLPLRRVGCYVPGGRAAYPSTVLHTVIPARVAGVDEILVATPPPVADAVLAACAIAKVDRILLAGGAQAIFALAYGTETIPRVDKIVGPGNVYVAAAKALVAPDVATDAPAGPSEVFVVADRSAPPEVVAWELAAQAEHDPHAACVLATPDPRVGAETTLALSRILRELGRQAIVTEALARQGAILTTRTLDEALALAEEYAPEHLVLMVEDPRAALAKTTTYGSAFLGATSPVAAGDYATGPNHVLPTSGLARGRAGLSVDDFVRKPTHQKLTPAGLASIAKTVERLANAEGLDAHAASVQAREGSSKRRASALRTPSSRKRK